MRILALNAGSSSLKLRVIGSDGGVVATADLARKTGEPVRAALSLFLDQAGSFDAVGHRVVHGGDEFRTPVLLDERAEASLERLADLAPLHNPPAIEAVRLMRHMRPGLRRLPASTPRSTPACLRRPRPTPCRTLGTPDGVCVCTGSTASATRTPVGGGRHSLGCRCQNCAS